MHVSQTSPRSQPSPYSPSKEIYVLKPFSASITKPDLATTMGRVNSSGLRNPVQSSTQRYSDHDRGHVASSNDAKELSYCSSPSSNAAVDTEPELWSRFIVRRVFSRSISSHRTRPGTCRQRSSSDQLQKARLQLGAQSPRADARSNICDGMEDRYSSSWANKHAPCRRTHLGGCRDSPFH
jgi:hypothetical protein